MQAIVFDLDETLLDRSRAVTRFAELLWQNYLASTGADTAAFVDEVHRLALRGNLPVSGQKE